MNAPERKYSGECHVEILYIMNYYSGKKKLANYLQFPNCLHYLVMKYDLSITTVTNIKKKLLLR